MKIRAITIGVYLTPSDCLCKVTFTAKIAEANENLRKAQAGLEELGYTVQTVRISFNSFEDWLIPALASSNLTLLEVLTMINEILESLNVSFCSFGGARTLDGIRLIPTILHHCKLVSCSSILLSTNSESITCDRQLSIEAAKTCLSVYRECGDLGNFRYCSSFHTPANVPFFPASFHEGPESVVSIGLENGDLLFLGCHAAKSYGEANQTLVDIFTQAYVPIEAAVSSLCADLGVRYGGIDASLNPGLGLPDGVARWLESLLPAHDNKFGHPGTLAAVSTVTSAVKKLAGKIKLAGYSGLMLPVMEDMTLAERASEAPPCFTLRDLLLFSTVCGVGLDTVPISAQCSAEEIAAVYEEVGALAARYKKPLSCRLLPLPLNPGETTNVSSSYLCNTKVFPLS